MTSRKAPGFLCGWLAVLSLAACQWSVPPPRLSNAFGVDVVVIAEFTSGQHWTVRWPACESVPVAPMEGLTKVTVAAEDGRTLLLVDAAELTRLAAAVKTGTGGTGAGHWVADGNGVHPAPQGAGDACHGRP